MNFSVPWPQQKASGESWKVFSVANDPRVALAHGVSGADSGPSRGIPQQVALASVTPRTASKNA
jgi:hypothetical protein